MNTLVITLLIISFTITSCQNDKGKKVIATKPDKNEMADINRYFVQKDRELIQNFIERKKLNMTESPTGLWFYIKKKGEGKMLKDKDKVSFEYICYLLDGTECYNSGKTGPREIVLGRSEIESGLYEGLQMLRPGGEAIFIIPPFLAWGLVGDGESIPSRAIIVYEITINK